MWLVDFEKDRLLNLNPYRHIVCSGKHIIGWDGNSSSVITTLETKEKAQALFEAIISGLEKEGGLIEYAK